MESLPLIPKSNIVPNLDVTSLIREVFQNEFESDVPSKKLSENLKRAHEFKNNLEEEESEKESYHSLEFLENIKKDRYDLVSYAENIYEASIFFLIDFVTIFPFFLLKGLKGREGIREKEKRLDLHTQVFIYFVCFICV